MLYYLKFYLCGSLGWHECINACCGWCRLLIVAERCSWKLKPMKVESDLKWGTVQAKLNNVVDDAEVGIHASVVVDLETTNCWKQMLHTEWK